MKILIVGLGSMGWHDVYHKLDITFDSEEAIKLSSDIYEYISYHAIQSSSLLAKERGRSSLFTRSGGNIRRSVIAAGGCTTDSHQ